MSDIQLTEREKNSISVTIRIRPASEKEKTDGAQICVHTDPKYPNTIILDTNPESKYFSFDYIANENSTQEEIFNEVAKPSTISCLEGYNTCIFAYGQTGAGKTYTITGPSVNYTDYDPNLQQRGMLPRVLEYIYAFIQKDLRESPEIEYLIKCSYLEIYNERIIDLLNPSTGNLQLREDLKRGVYVEGLVEENISNLQASLQILNFGQKNRHIGSTSMNDESSRSHSVFTLYLDSKKTTNGVTHLRYSRFNFVDLAGSERQKLTNAIGDRLKEGCNINKSLHILGNVINALVEVTEGKVRHIHYRDSKLTFFLKDSLGGNSKTRFIANICPITAAYHETLSTLKFAKRVKLIKNKASINEDSSGNLECLKNEIRRLKMELARARSCHPMILGAGDTLADDELNSSSISQSLLKNASFNQSLSIISPLKKVKTNPNGNSGLPQDIRQIYEKNQAMLQLEELIRQYFEQSHEMEMNLHIEFVKREDTINQLRKAFQIHQQNEQQFRMMIQLYEARVKRLQQPQHQQQFHSLQKISEDQEEKESLVKQKQQLISILESKPYILKTFYENLDLREQVNRYEEQQKLSQSNTNSGVLSDFSVQKQLKYNIQLLEKVQEMVEENVAQRKEMQNQLADLAEYKQQQQQLQQSQSQSQTPQKSQIQQIQTSPSKQQQKWLEEAMISLKNEHINKVETLNLEILDLKQTVDEKDKLIDDLIQQNQSQNQEIMQLKDNLKENEYLNASRQLQMAKASQSGSGSPIKSSKSEESQNLLMISLSEQLDQQKESNSKQNIEIQNLQAQIELLEKAIAQSAQVNAQLEQRYNVDVTRLEMDIENYQTQISDLQNENIDLKQDVNQPKVMLSNVSSNNGAASHIYSNILKNFLSSIQTDLLIKADISQEQQLLDSITVLYQQPQSDSNSGEKNKEEQLQAFYDQKLKNLKGLFDTIIEQLKAGRAAQKTFIAQKQQQEILENEYSEMQVNIQQAELKIQQYSQEQSRQKQKLDSQNKQIEDLNEELQRISQEQSAAVEESDRLRADLEQRDQEYQQLQEQLNKKCQEQHIAKIQTIEQQLNKQKQEQALLEEELSEAQSNVSTKNQEIEDLGNQLEQTKQQLNEARNSLAESQQQLADLSQKISQNDELFNQKTITEKTLQNQLMELRDQVEAANNSKQIIVDEKSKLELQLNEAQCQFELKNEQHLLELQHQSQLLEESVKKEQQLENELKIALKDLQAIQLSSQTDKNELSLVVSKLREENANVVQQLNESLISLQNAEEQQKIQEQAKLELAEYKLSLESKLQEALSKIGDLQLLNEKDADQKSQEIVQLRQELSEAQQQVVIEKEKINQWNMEREMKEAESTTQITNLQSQINDLESKLKETQDCSSQSQQQNLIRQLAMQQKIQEAELQRDGIQEQLNEAIKQKELQQQQIEAVQQEKEEIITDLNLQISVMEVQIQQVKETSVVSESNNKEQIRSLQEKVQEQNLQLQKMYDKEQSANQIAKEQQESINYLQQLNENLNAQFKESVANLQSKLLEEQQIVQNMKNAQEASADEAQNKMQETIQAYEAKEIIYQDNISQLTREKEELLLLINKQEHAIEEKDLSEIKYSAQITQLTADLANYNSKLLEEQSLNEQNQQQIQYLEQLSQQLEQKVKNLEQQVVENQQQIKEYQLQIQELDRISQQHEELTQQYQEVSTQQQETQQLLIASQNENKILVKKINELTDQLASVQDINNQLETDLNSLSIAKGSSEDQFKIELRNTQSVLLSQIEQLEQSNKNINSQLVQQTQYYEDSQNELEAAKQNIYNLENQLSAQQQQQIQLQKENQDQIAHLNQNFQIELQSALKEQNAQLIQEHNDVLESKQQEIDQMSQELNRLSEVVEDIEQQKNNILQEKETLYQQFEDSQQQIQALNQQYSALIEQQQQRFTQENENLQDQLKQALQYQSELNKKLEKAQANNQEQERQVAQLMKKKNESDQQLLEANNQLQQVKAIAMTNESQLQDQISQLQSELQNLNEELIRNEQELQMTQEGVNTQLKKVQTSMLEDQERLKETIKQKELEAEQLRTDFKSQMDKNEALVKESSAAHASLFAAQKDYREVQISLAEQTRLKAKAEQSAKELDHKLELLETEIQNFKREMQGLASEKTQRIAAIEDLQRELTQKKDVIAVINEENRKLMAILSETEQRHTEELRGIHAERKKVLAELEQHRAQAMNNNCAAELDKFRMLTENLQTQNEELLREGQEKDELNKKLLHKLNELKEELSKKTAEALKNDDDELDQRIRSENNNLIESLRKNQQMLQDAQNNFSQAKKEVQDMRKAIEDKNKQIIGQKSEIQQKEQTFNTIHEKARDYCKSLEREIAEIKEEYLKLEKEHVFIMNEFKTQGQELEKVKAELQETHQERDKIQEEFKLTKGLEKKLKKEYQDLIDTTARRQEEYNQLLAENTELQRENSEWQGHQNPDQKIRYLNKIKEDNNQLKKDKVFLSEQLAQVIDEKNKLLKKLEQFTKGNKPTAGGSSVSNSLAVDQRQLSSNKPGVDGRTERSDSPLYRAELQKKNTENQFLKEGISKLNTIININGFGHQHYKQGNQASNSMDSVIQGVQALVQELMDKNNSIKDKEKELDAKNLKYSIIEKEYLLLKQKLQQLSNNSNNQSISCSQVQHPQQQQLLLLQQQQQQQHYGNNSFLINSSFRDKSSEKPPTSSNIGQNSFVLQQNRPQVGIEASGDASSYKENRQYRNGSEEPNSLSNNKPNINNGYVSGTPGYLKRNSSKNMLHYNQ